MKALDRPRWAKWALGAVGALGLSTLAFAAGFLTNGLPTPTPGGPASQVTSRWLLPADTSLTGGQNPASVAVTPFQVAGIFAEAFQNLQTSTVHAATSNTIAGVVTTEALTTAAGATYTFTLTDSLITTATVMQVGMYSLSNTGGAISLTSVTPASGSVVFVFTNTGTTAFNGTMNIVFHV